MRPEQVAKLGDLEEKLVDLFVTEAEIEKWPDMETRDSRGDRYWHKKNALATLTLVGRIQTVLRDARGEGGLGDDKQPPRGDGIEEPSIEQEAARLEKQGIALLDRKRANRRR